MSPSILININTVGGFKRWLLISLDCKILTGLLLVCSDISVRKWKEEAGFMTALKIIVAFPQRGTHVTSQIKDPSASYRYA